MSRSNIERLDRHWMVTSCRKDVLVGNTPDVWAFQISIYKSITAEFPKRRVQVHEDRLGGSMPLGFSFSGFTIRGSILLNNCVLSFFYLSHNSSSMSNTVKILFLGTTGVSNRTFACVYAAEYLRVQVTLEEPS